jgi:predicted permease
MSWIKRLAASFRRRKLEDDLEKELAFHLEMRAREKTDAGISPDDARRQVLHRFGDVSRAKEACRDHSTFAWVAALPHDLRYAARNLRKTPAFTAAAVACMAIGIGANAAIFSFVNAFLFQPLPRDVVMVHRATGNPISYPEYQDWRRLNTSFDGVFAHSVGERFTIGRGVDAAHVLGETVAGSYFQSLGVLPSAGRLLMPGDESRPLAVLGYQYWRSRFSADPAIVGKTIWINHDAFTIQGVAPQDFHGMLAPWSTDVWATPYLHRDTWTDRRTGWLMAGARLKPGVTPKNAETAMNVLDRELARLNPRPTGRPQPSDPLTVARRGGLSGSQVWMVFTIMSALLMAVVGIIFLIACANVAGLLIARSLARQRELLIRLSLGATRSRLVAQLLTESLMLGMLGATAGIFIAFAAGDALAGIFPKSISGGFRFEHGIDLRVLAYTLALSIAGALVSGLLPALRASDQDLPDAGRTQTSVGTRVPRLRQLLIVAQVAASVVVLATAGLFIQSFLRGQGTDPGFDAFHLLTVDIDLREMKYPKPRAARFYDRLQSRIAEIPGVISASFADVLPFGNEDVVNIPNAGDVATATVDSRYFATMGIPLLRGRLPQPGDHDVALVNDAFARRFWPNQDPIGQSIRHRQIVGVTATGKYWSLQEPPRPFLYQIATEFAVPQLCLAIRTQASPLTIAARVRQEVQSLDDDLPMMSIRTGEDRISAWLEPQRAAAVLLTLLGLAALGLATTGLYALLAQTVSQRTPEIAVRVALGAGRRTIVGMLLRQTAVLIVAGTTAGIAAAAAVARLLATLAGQVNPLDAITLAAVAMLLAVIGLAATIIPASRALRIDPVVSLRSL